MNTNTIHALTRIADEYERKAAALRAVIADLTHDATTTARASLNGKLRAASNHRAAARNGTQGGDKAASTLAAFTALAERPRDAGDLLAAMQAAHIPIRKVNGAVSKWVSTGFVARQPDGAFRLTAKGKRRLADLQQQRQDVHG